MKKITGYSYFDLCKILHHQKVNFISDCDFFPDFNVTVYVYNIYLKDQEVIFETKNISNGKKLTIGSNMKNLQFKII